LYNQKTQLSDLILKNLLPNQIEKIQTQPESRREWMLERFKLAAKKHTAIKKSPVLAIVIRRKIYSSPFMVKVKLYPS
jgi:hypothetical protein